MRIWQDYGLNISTLIKTAEIATDLFYLPQHFPALWGGPISYPSSVRRDLQKTLLEQKRYVSLDGWRIDFCLHYNARFARSIYAYLQNLCYQFGLLPFPMWHFDTY
jgi:hypothetical protein